MTPPWSDAFAENNHLSFNSCPRTAKRGSISGRHEHAPSFRFLPQRGQMPLQSGLQSSFESMFSTNAVVRISSRSAISPSCRRKVHSSASSSRSSEREDTGGVAHRPLGGDGLLHGKTPAELQIVQIQRGMEGQNTVRLLHDF